MRYVKTFIFLILTLVIFNLAITAQIKKLTKSQIKTLNRKLSFKVRNFLETADKLEILTDTIREPVDEKPIYIPNKSYVVKNAVTRKKVLDFFYWDVANGGGDAACYYPNHSIIAKKGNKTVSINICYPCNKFVVSGAFGKCSVGLWGEPISEDLINKLIEQNGVPIK